MNPFYAVMYYVKNNKFLVLFLALILVCLILVGCGDDDVNSNQNPSSDMGQIISFCSEYQPQVRVYLSHSYGGASIALIEDLNC